MVEGALTPVSDLKGMLSLSTWIQADCGQTLRWQILKYADIVSRATSINPAGHQCYMIYRCPPACCVKTLAPDVKTGTRDAYKSSLLDILVL